MYYEIHNMDFHLLFFIFQVSLMIISINGYQLNQNEWKSFFWWDCIHGLPTIHLYGINATAHTQWQKKNGFYSTLICWKSLSLWNAWKFVLFHSHTKWSLYFAFRLSGNVDITFHQEEQKKHRNEIQLIFQFCILLVCVYFISYYMRFFFVSFYSFLLNCHEVFSVVVILLLMKCIYG